MQFVKKNFLKIAIFLMFTTRISVCHQTKYLHSADINVMDFSVDDILNNDIIPVQIVTDQLGHLFNNNYRGDEQVFLNTPEMTCLNSTDLSSAVRAMRYHRYKMNEYLLSGYLSNEISNTYNFTEPSIEKRSGKAKNNSYTDNLVLSSDKNMLPTNHKLIEDEGSSQYSSWLKRMNTFEDIQKQLLNKRSQHSEQRKKYSANRRQSLNINLEPTYGETDTDDGIEYLDDGDITGYAFTNNPTEHNAPINFYKNRQKSLIEGKAGNLDKQTINKAGYDNGYDDYNAAPHPVPNLVSTGPTKQTKEIGLKDITDIALTTLAFLSFGMFILQVLMCITMSKDDTSNVVMLPMEGTDNGDIPGDDNTEEIRRKRRSIPSTQMQNIEVIDHLAKMALFSLNAVISMSKDGGACHHYSLCKNNKFARRLQDTKKLWIPVWSLGMSWLTMKFNNSNRMSQLRNDSPVMNSLKAIILGLNNGHCSIHYKNKCKVLNN